MRLISGALLLLGFLLAAPASASYNTLPRANAASLGMTDANVALARGPAAQFTNPANLIAYPPPGDDWQWEAGGLFGRVTADLLTAGPTSEALSSETGYPIIPFAAFAVSYSERLNAGFSVESPFGVALEWPDHSFELDLGSLGSHDIAQEAEIAAVRIGPALAWRFDERFSAGARVFLHYVDAREINDLGSAKGDGQTVGAQVGINYHTAEYAIAASFTTRTNTHLKGTTTRIGTPAMSGETHIRLPARLQVGASRRVADDVWWELDLDWIGWSYINDLTLTRSDGTILNEGRTDRDYDDTLSVRTGFRWAQRETRVVYAGVAYEPTPVPETDAAPTVNNLSMTRVGLGVGLMLGTGLRLDLAYQYVRGHSRRIAETRQDDILGVDTGLFEGKYRSESHVLGLTLGGSF